MSERTRASKNGFWLLLAGTLTAVGASACCVIPFILLTLGIGGSWLSSLSRLEPYRPLFIGATLLLLTFAFHRIYLAPRVCDRGSSRAQHNAIKRLRLAFWITSTLAFGLIALPWLIPLFYSH
jgi:mercuric ion transport protein